MICSRCLFRARASRNQISSFTRAITSTASTSAQGVSPRPEGHPAATSTSAAQPFSTPLSSGPDASSIFQKPSKTKSQHPESSVPAGTILKGLNYTKGRDDPAALEDEAYPEWLWGLLEVKKTAEGEEAEGDEFSKSKKIRRAVAKRARKLQALREASGDTEYLQPKIPLQQQTIDLPGNEEGTVRGALDAAGVREDLRKAMRGERRKKIKEANYLKGMR